MVDLVIQFRSRGWSGSADTFGTWRTITCDVLGAGWTRGNAEHRGLLNFPEQTQANVQLYDPDRDYDPSNTSGQYYGQIDVGCDIQFLFGGRQVFLGRITTLDHVLQTPVGNEAPYSIASIDAQSYQGKFGLINLHQIAAPLATFETDEVTSARINRILDYCAVPAAARDIESGGVMHWDVNVRAGNGIAWDHIVMTMRSELGSLEIMPSGVIRTRNRNTVWNTNPAATLQLGCHAGAIPIYAAEFATVRDTVRNSVNTSWENINADEQRLPREDATSIAKYGKRTFNEEMSLYKDLENAFALHETWKTFFLSKMKSPMKSWRVETRPTTQAEIDSIESTVLWTGRARLTINQAAGPDIDQTLRLIGMEWSVDPDGSVCRLVLGNNP